MKDLDLDQHRLLVRSGKGDKDRSTLLPQGLLYTHVMRQNAPAVTSPLDRLLAAAEAEGADT